MVLGVALLAAGLHLELGRTVFWPDVYPSIATALSQFLESFRWGTYDKLTSEVSLVSVRRVPSLVKTGISKLKKAATVLE